MADTWYRCLLILIDWCSSSKQIFYWQLPECQMNFAQYYKRRCFFPLLDFAQFSPNFSNSCSKSSPIYYLVLPQVSSSSSELKSIERRSKETETEQRRELDILTQEIREQMSSLFIKRPLQSTINPTITQALLCLWWIWVQKATW